MRMIQNLLILMEFHFAFLQKAEILLHWNGFRKITQILSLQSSKRMLMLLSLFGMLHQLKSYRKAMSQKQSLSLLAHLTKYDL